jgi:hypothetical protein
MNTLSTLDRIITATRLSTVLDHLGNRLLPSLDAEAGLIDCYKIERAFSCLCVQLPFYKRNYVKYFARSSSCMQGWPICGGCPWTAIEAGCENC